MHAKFSMIAIAATVLFSVSSHGAGKKWFLTHNEFKNLTRAEQKQYLKKTKAVLASLPEMSDAFASKTTKKRAIANAAPAAATPQHLTVEQINVLVTNSEQWRGTPPEVITDYLRESTIPTYRENYKNSMWWLVMARAGIAKVPKEDPKRAEMEKRIVDLEDFYGARRAVLRTSIAKNGELDAVYDTLRKTQKGELTMDSPGLVPNGTLVKFDDKQVVNIVMETPPAAAAETPAVQDIAAATPPVPEMGGYRCMYAGFVIKQDPCKGPQSLPEDILFKGIDSAKISCGEEEILCNPLLFGLKKDCAITADTKDEDAQKCLATAEPVCVKRGKYATRDCGKVSAGDSYLESAAALIRLNPGVWTSYMTSFYELCDDKMIVMNDFTQTRDGQPREIPEKTLKDVEQTCQNAKKRLAQITEQYRNVDSTRPPKAKPEAGAPATEGQN